MDLHFLMSLMKIAQIQYSILCNKIALLKLGGLNGHMHDFKIFAV